MPANLDRIENIACLCPTCHKKAHHSDDKSRKLTILKLFNRRIEKFIQTKIDISFEDLFKKYY